MAGLRQRLGRSGRREGRPALLRLYVAEDAVSARNAPPAALRIQLFQSTAMVALLLEGWVEPPKPAAVDLSTLLHQTLALIAERGGLHARQAWETLCAPGAPFSHAGQSLYVALLRRMGDPDIGLIEQAPDGTQLLGRAGERMADHYDFYTVFETAEDYRVVHGSRTLGTLPMTSVLVRGATLIFAGRRWTVLEVADREKLITVEPSSAGKAPMFSDKGGGDLDDRVVRTMFELYRSVEEPAFLDAPARALLAEGRDAFARLRLADSALAAEGGSLWLFPWVGTLRLTTAWAPGATAWEISARCSDIAAVSHFGRTNPAALPSAGQMAPNSQADLVL